MEQKNSIFVCRASGAFYSFLTKIACSALWRGFRPCFATGNMFLMYFIYNAFTLRKNLFGSSEKLPVSFYSAILLT